MNTIIDAIISHPSISGPTTNSGMSEVRIMLKGGDKWIYLFKYYGDELSFREEEFIGLTEDEGRALFTKKDIAYLQS